MSSVLVMLRRTSAVLGGLLVRAMVQVVVLALGFVLVLGVVAQYALIVFGPVHGLG
jgi:hypothetical protein